MSTYADALEAICDTVNAAALTTPAGHTLFATRDPSRLQQGAPTLLVMVQTITVDAMCSDGTADVVGLLVGVAGDPAMSDLLELIDPVMAMLTATNANRATWTPPGADPLPCFQITAD